MATGYILKQLANDSFTGSGAAVLARNLFTVPAGHIYVVKKAHFRLARTAAGAHTIRVERSDTGGANFRTVSDLFVSPAAANNSFVNLTPSVQQAQTNTLTAEAGGGGVIQTATIENLVCEAGTILRISSAGTFQTTDSIQTAVDGFDYTV